MGSLVFQFPLFFVSERAKEQKNDSLVKKSESLLLLFCHEQPERIDLCCSFVKSNRSESLTVALLFRGTWAIHSRSIFKERATERRVTGSIHSLDKKGKNCQKHTKNTIFSNFFKRNCSVLIALLLFRSQKISELIKKPMSEFPTMTKNPKSKIF